MYVNVADWSMINYPM